jgi:predicted  nucleic acid-binding Zn-ribbon protein
MSETVDYKEQLTKLIALQELDAEIYDLRSKKELIPERLEEINSSLEGKKGAMESADKELKDLQVAKGDKENEMASLEEKVKKHEADLYQIKNNKEYKALQQEIESIKADISLLEEDIINLLDKIDAAQTKMDDEKKIFETEKQKAGSEQEDIKKEEKEIDARLAELDGKRKDSVQGVDPTILARYERILENRAGIALAKVEGEFCGKCHMTLRPQVINEARLKKNPVFCESCSRILYAEEEGN